MQNISDSRLKMSTSESNEEEAEQARFCAPALFPVQVANTAFKRGLQAVRDSNFFCRIQIGGKRKYVICLFLVSHPVQERRR
jgi:hypothetical protein